MKTKPMNEMPLDRIEITLRTDAELGLPEKVKCEKEVREILSMDGVEICDLSFQKGSTIITVGILVGAGLAFCFTHFFGGALKKFGERGAEFLLAQRTSTKGDELANSNANPLESTDMVPVKSITSLLPEVGSGSGWPKEAMALIVSAETAGHAMMAFAYNLPGIERSIKIVAVTYNEETQERVEEIYQRKISKG
jgi:hypothetical protein